MDTETLSIILGKEVTKIESDWDGMCYLTFFDTEEREHTEYKTLLFKALEYIRDSD